MDQSTAERIATALEQIALELGTVRIADTLPMPVRTFTPAPATTPAASGPAYPAVSAAPSFAPISGPAVNTAFVPAECPIHKRPWRINGRGPYCSGKLDSGQWCNQKPTAPRAVPGQALP